MTLAQEAIKSLNVLKEKGRQRRQCWRSKSESRVQTGEKWKLDLEANEFSD